jgi:hypothetical protein
MYILNRQQNCIYRKCHYAVEINGRCTEKIQITCPFYILLRKKNQYSTRQTEISINNSECIGNNSGAIFYN